MRVGLLRALDTWLAEDRARVEHRLVAPPAAARLVALFADACAARDAATMPQTLDALRLMLGRCAAGGGRAAGGGGLRGRKGWGSLFFVSSWLLCAAGLLGCWRLCI